MASVAAVLHKISKIRLEKVDFERNKLSKIDFTSFLHDADISFIENVIGRVD